MTTREFTPSGSSGRELIFSTQIRSNPSAHSPSTSLAPSADLNSCHWTGFPSRRYSAVLCTHCAARGSGALRCQAYDSTGKKKAFLQISPTASHSGGSFPCSVAHTSVASLTAATALSRWNTRWLLPVVSGKGTRFTMNSVRMVAAIMDGPENKNSFAR